MFRKLLFSIAILLLPVPCLAQVDTVAERGRAFIQRELPKESLIKALADNDRSVLRATPKQFMEAVRLGSGMSFKSTNDFVTWLASLEVVPCGNKNVSMGRIMEPSGKLSMNYLRVYRKGEMCLRDNNSGLMILSLLCGNPVNNSMQMLADKRTTRDTTEEKAKVQVVKTGPDSVRVYGQVGLFLGDTALRNAIVRALSEKTKAPTDTTKVVAKKSNKGWWIAGIVATGLVSWAIWNNNHERNINVCAYCGETATLGPKLGPNGLRSP